MIEVNRRIPRTGLEVRASGVVEFQRAIADAIAKYSLSDERGDAACRRPGGSAAQLPKPEVVQAELRGDVSVKELDRLHRIGETRCAILRPCSPARRQPAI
jgi:hypothetical protein